jgi:diguanylate cyclase (GGDEF)-like protein
MFAVAESTQLHVEVRRQTVSLSLSEFPLVLGLFLTDPATLLLTRVAAGLLLAGWRRAPLYKTGFNAAIFLLEVGLAAVLFDAVRGTDELGPQAWAAAFVATLGVSTVTGGCVLAAVARLQGRMGRHDVVLWFTPLLASAVLSTTSALLALLVGRKDARAVLLLVLIAGLSIAGYRAYGTLLRRHETLELLQAYTSAMGAGGGADALMSQALRHTRGLLSSDCAQVVLVGDGADGGQTARSLRQRGELEGPADAAQRALVDDVLAGAAPRRLVRGTQRPDEVAWLSAAGLRDALVVPLVGRDGVVGALLVGERLGEMASFTDDDLQLLQMLAAHLEIALRSADLVERLRDEATHDALTRLPNRTLFHERLSAAVDGRRRGESFAVVFMDLDGFKDVNDTLGHESGDRVLVEVAARLAAAVPDGVTVARLGGDEFALLVPVGDDPGDIDVLAGLLHGALRPALVVCDVELEVRASIGVALCPEHGDDSSALLRHADVAMYDAKAAQLPVRVYSAEIDRSNPRRLALVNDLRLAVESGELVCHYQPKVRVCDIVPTGVEALVRWQHPTLGTIAPDDFIPIAEHTGLIVPLTAFVLRTALTHCAEWTALGHDLDVAVNVSPRALLAPEFVPGVQAALEDAGVPPGKLTLEVTESSVMHDTRRATQVLHALHELGVQLSVDDFGTGYSSLAYLQQLPVDEVKVDKSFVADLATDAGDVAIVRAIVDLGHNLGLRVVAEGVEDARSLAVLQSLGCDSAQGYLVSRPLPHDRLLAWLTRPAMPVVAAVPSGPRLVALS